MHLSGLVLGPDHRQWTQQITRIQLVTSPHFSPGSREQAQDLARMSHQMDEPSLDL
jgi:hypothetical protein